MGFSTLTDPFLIVGLWVGIVAVALTLLVAGLIVFMRLGLRRREQRWDRFVEVWRPLLLDTMMTPSPPPLPKLAPRHHQFFLRLWVYLHESVRGDAAERLNRVARLLGIYASAERMLRSGSRGARLLAIVSLGHLGDRRAWDALAQLAASEDGLISVNAARALVQIDAFDGAKHLMPLILARRDWDVARVAGFLQEAREAFWLLLIKTLPELPVDDLPRALRLAEALRLSLPVATLQFLLDARQPVRVLAAALRVADNAEVADAVRRCLRHADPRVREQAARQMARLGTQTDVLPLVALLADRDWSVRLSAARTLSQLPYLTVEQLAELHREGSAAHDMLRHVMAEQAGAA